MFCGKLIHFKITMICFHHKQKYIVFNETIFHYTIYFISVDCRPHTVYVWVGYSYIIIVTHCGRTQYDALVVRIIYFGH